MYGRIIERISCDDLGLVISITVAETGGVVVHPGNGTAVFLHLANVADVPDIGDPVVLLIQKSGKEGHKELMRTLVQSGVEPGLIAYADGVPAGWVALGAKVATLIF